MTCKKAKGKLRDWQGGMGGEGMQEVDHSQATSNSCQIEFLRPLFQHSPQSTYGERELVVWRHSGAGLSLLALMFPQVKWWHFWDLCACSTFHCPMYAWRAAEPKCSRMSQLISATSSCLSWVCGCRVFNAKCLSTFSASLSLL